jgi:putative phosphoribosyl transferase
MTEVSVGERGLPGTLTVPDRAKGLVLFAHGSGSSRHSPRSRLVAERLGREGLATLLFDLLTTEEADDRRNVFDVELLAGRLLDATSWARARAATSALAIGYFGASTGAAAALVAAAGDPFVGAVVSRGGRPDLAGGRLAEVRAPTLLVVGSVDTEVLRLNRLAAQQLRCEHEVAVVPGATHLFAEPGTLEAAADLALVWFASHLRSVAAGDRN